MPTWRRFFNLRAGDAQFAPRAAEAANATASDTSASLPEATGEDPGAGADPLALVAQVLEVATREAGFSWHASGMTVDEAINALPVDLAAAVVKVMHRLFGIAGDRENSSWTEAKLHEIQMLELGYHRLQNIALTAPRDALTERARELGVTEGALTALMGRLLSGAVPTVAELHSLR